MKITQASLLKFFATLAVSPILIVDSILDIIRRVFWWAVLPVVFIYFWYEWRKK